MAIDVERYYRTHGPMVLRRCRKLLRDEEQARDAMHDVFVQLLRHGERLDGTGPASLLFRIATNVCLNRLRTRRRQPEDGAEELMLRIAGTDDPAARSLARGLLRRLFAAGGDDSAVVAVLYLHDRMTLEEVAAELKMSVSGVRKRLRKLRGQLSELEDV